MEPWRGSWPAHACMHACKSWLGCFACTAAGGPLPEGADAVVQIEDTEFLGVQDGKRRVRILKAVPPSCDVREASWVQWVCALFLLLPGIAALFGGCLGGLSEG
jgi:hypothetical protein